MGTDAHPAPIPEGAPLKFGEQTFTFGDEVAELEDSVALLGDFDALRHRLREDGYLFIRGFHPRAAVDAARERVLRHLRDLGALALGTDWREGIAGEENRSFGFFRQVEIAHSPEVLAVVDGPHTFEFYERLLGGPVLTFDKRWLRCMAKGGHNHFHYDSAYVGRGTRNRLTMWSAFTDIGLENGPLVLCLNSHRSEELIRTYGQIDMDRDLIDPVFSADAGEMVHRFGFTLATAHFRPGDVILFGLHMMHSSLPNLSDRYRISIDTRYQLASEESDERFFGEGGNWLGNFYNKGAEYAPMSEMRRKWGLEG
jgi:hypothetical protein